MQKKWVNPKAGQKCGGVCDKCHRSKEFIWHGIGVMCESCAEKVDSRKLRLPFKNHILTEHCVMCSKREETMYRVNWGFCPDCLRKQGIKFNRTKNEEAKKTMRNLKKFEEKTNSQTLNEEEAEKQYKEAKRERLKKLRKSNK